MTRVLSTLLALSLLASAGSSPQNAVSLFWTPDLSGIWFEPSRPRPEGVFVLVSDKSPETTHYYVTVNFLRNDGTAGWCDLLFRKLEIPYTPAVLQASEVRSVTSISVVAVKVTGFLSVP